MFIHSFLAFSSIVGAAFPTGVSDDLEEKGVVAIEQRLLDVQTIGRAMNLAAHPDDEDGATLALLRHKHGLRTFAVFANRGEGGQNEIGSELYRELGAIREGETLRAAARLGAKAVFLGLEDFGYSKTADESFERWGGRDAVVERLVYAYRRLRPDVVFTNHDPHTGHGQHRAMSIAGREAFYRADDPAAFPEQGLAPWSPTIYLERTSAAQPKDERGEPIDRSALIVLDPDAVDPIRGTTFHEQAHAALKEHRSQGRWERGGRGPRAFRVVARRHTEELPSAADPFDPVELTRLRLFRAIDDGALEPEETDRLLHRRFFRASFPPATDRDALFAALVEQRGKVSRALGRSGRSGTMRDSLRADLAEIVSILNETIAHGLGAGATIEPVREPVITGRDTALRLTVREG